MAKVVPERQRVKRRWYVARCRSSQERTAKEQLENQRFKTYLPLTMEVRRGSEREVPLFPCYLFVHFDPTKKSSRTVRYTRGVIDLIRFGDSLAVVPEEVIGALLESENAFGIRENETLRFELGDTVRMLGGPFEGLLGKIARADRGGRVMVLLQCLGALHRVEVAREIVERIDGVE